MSSTNDTTQYTISINIEAAGVGGFMNLTVDQTDTFQDADAFATFNALVAAFPAAWNAANSSSIQKAVLNDTYYTGAATATPPVFE